MAEIVGRRKVIYHKKGHMTCMTILRLHVSHVFKGKGSNKKKSRYGRKTSSKGRARQKKERPRVGDNSWIVWTTIFLLQSNATSRGSSFTGSTDY